MRWPVLLLLVPLVAVGLVLAGSHGGDAPEAVWLEAGRGEGQVVYPRGIARDAEHGWWYVVDRAARIQRLDDDGRFLNAWTTPADDLGKPVGLTIGPDGNVWVPDTHYCRVIVYTPTGEEVMRFGEPGDGPGQFRLPTDVAFDAAGHVYVSEYNGNDRIQVFDRHGKYLREFGRFGDGPGEFNRPQSIAIAGDTLYVADAVNHEIDVFGLDGTFRRSVGDGLRYPYGLDVLPGGELLVTEFGHNRVSRLDPATGRTTATWGRAGRMPGELAFPWSAAADASGRIVIVDSGNNRLQVVRF